MSWKSIAHSNILINIDIWPTKFVILSFGVFGFFLKEFADTSTATYKKIY